MSTIRHPVSPPHSTTGSRPGELYRRTAEYGCAVDGPHRRRLSIDDKVALFCFALTVVLGVMAVTGVLK